MARVVHFEIHADDLDRAERFYRGVQRWEGPVDYRLLTTGAEDEAGINGALVERRGPVDGQAVIAYVCTIDHRGPSRHAGGRAGGRRRAGPGAPGRARRRPPRLLQGHGGNIFGAMQADPSAA